MGGGLNKTIGNIIFNWAFIKQNRHKQMVNLNDAGTIGIIYLVKDEKTFNSIKKLTLSLSGEKRDVIVAGYIIGKEFPNYCIASNSGYFFNNQSLRWTGIPKNDYLSKFIEKEFDILFDFSQDNIFTLKYITGLSKAKLKVGEFSADREKYLDLMINTKPNTSLDELIYQTVYYLRTIKSR